MVIEIRYHSNYESEAKQLESFLEDGLWDANREMCSEDEDGNYQLDVLMVESEDDLYDVVVDPGENEKVICSNPSNNDEVVTAIFKREWKQLLTKEQAQQRFSGEHSAPLSEDNWIDMEASE
tara:strand:- start:543 stop:908 length:366 start_codon:yes stop_codon:yes gene_type:complete